MHFAHGRGTSRLSSVHLSFSVDTLPHLSSILIRGSGAPSHFHTYDLLRMGLLRRQITYTYIVFDDQGPGLWGNYVGNWSHYTHQGFSNYTFTATSTPGASLSLTFSGTYVLYVWSGLQNTDAMAQIGSQVTVTGGTFPSSDNSTSGLPTANYIVDGVACESPDAIAP